MKKYLFTALYSIPAFLNYACSELPSLEPVSLNSDVNDSSNDGNVNEEAPPPTDVDPNLPLTDPIRVDNNNGAVKGFETPVLSAKVEKFQEPNEPISKLDLLIIPDTSGSMLQERLNVANGILDYVNQLTLNKKVDYRIGVMLPHVLEANALGTTGWSGRLFKAGSEPLVLSSDSQTPTSILNDLKTKMNKAVSENASDGGEAGLYTLYNAISSASKLAALKSQGLMREDAALAVLFVADENDICSRYLEADLKLKGITFRPDGENYEVPAYNKYCIDSVTKVGKVTHTEVLNRLKNIKGQLPLVNSGIIYIGQNALPPKSGEDEIGYGYKEFVELSKGLLIDLADPLPDNDPTSPNPARIASAMAKIGEMTAKKLDLIYEFKLAANNIMPLSIKVTVDGVAVNHTYESSLKLVRIAQGAGNLTFGSHIEISYQYMQ